MRDFVKTYAVDQNAAKAKYYNTKLHIDITKEGGEEMRRTLLRKYIEGIQWVLYYYYRGT
jgi:5'-3' exonuclease